MTGAVIVDTELLVLLVVGSASKDYIAKHKRLQEYSIDHYDLLGLQIAEFSEIVLLPHILAETSSFIRMLNNPIRARVQHKFGELITTALEFPIPSVSGAQRDEFLGLGLTDAVILSICEMRLSGIAPTLITADGPLADAASSLGCSVVDFKQEFLST